MKPIKSFKVFGELVELLISGVTTGGLSSTLIQTSPPGGGPPPHMHKNEDETFLVLEGEYEFLAGGKWTTAKAGDAVHGRRGSVHTFRNTGSTTGRVLIFVAPAGLERYLEEISGFSVPEDLAQLLAVSERYGITFV